MKSSHTLSKQITNINEQSKISMTDDLSLMDLATEVDAASPLELEEQCQSQRLTTSPHLDATENHSESEVLVMDVNYPCTLCDAVFDSDENLKKKIRLIIIPQLSPIPVVNRLSVMLFITLNAHFVI